MSEQHPYILSTIPSGPLATNTYLFICSTTRDAVVIDPAFGSCAEVEKELTQQHAHLKAIWLTHSHWDHIADCAAFRRTFGASTPICVHALDKENVASPGSDLLPMMLPIRPENPSVILRDGDVMECGRFRFQVLHTPGHSPGSCCFLDEGGQIMFTGDTLFRGTYGNVSFPGASRHDMIESLKRLSAIEKDDVVICPGHGPASRLSLEKKWMLPKIASSDDGH